MLWSAPDFLLPEWEYGGICRIILGFESMDAEMAVISVGDQTGGIAGAERRLISRGGRYGDSGQRIRDGKSGDGRDNASQEDRIAHTQIGIFPAE
ncbi:MAG: hypothetical protein RL386_1111 [Bacteroidota bacterium]|jgi:hypothetical protein